MQKNVPYTFPVLRHAVSQQEHWQWQCIAEILIIDNFNYVKRNLSSFHVKISFEKNCFTAWASTLNMGLINKVDMVCLSPVGYGV